MRRLMWIAVCLPFMVQAQGIRFENGLSWGQVKETAKSEHKFIFMDCYATWCGPCKWMTQNIFPQKEVGDFFNSHFVSIAVQMDRTVGDSQFIKNWYSDADSINKTYSIMTLPTYLFFSPDGILVHRVVGIPGDKGADLINKGMEALDPAKQYYELISDYKKHLQDSTYLENALEMALKNTDKSNAESIANAYVAQLKGPLDKKKLNLILRSIQSSQDLGFKFLLKHHSEFTKNNYVGNIDFALAQVIAHESLDSLFVDKTEPIYFSPILRQMEDKYRPLTKEVDYILSENYKGAIIKDIKSTIYKDRASLANWTEIEANAKERYPDFDTRQIIASEKWKYYLHENMVPDFENAIFAYLDNYKTLLGDNEINNCCYYLYQLSNNQALLNKALNYMKPVINGHDVRAYWLDTYASLLFKTGHKTDAIQFENQAIEKSSSNAEKAEFKKTLENMQGK